MLQNKKIHFEISERKILLRFFDILFVFFGMYFLSYIYNFNYFIISTATINYIIILLCYINIFGSVFEIYNLQIASNRDLSIRSILLTATSTVVFFLLTPYYTPSLPSNRFEIILFYFVILTSLLLWRLIYIQFLVSKRFVKKVILICDNHEVQNLIFGLENMDIHYKIIGYVNTNTDSKLVLNDNYVQNIPFNKIEDFLTNKNVKEIVIASHKTDSISPRLLKNLINLLERGFVIKEYRNVYEEITHKIPLQYVTTDFYNYFPFSKNSKNQLYLLFFRILDVIFSLIGVFFLIFLIPIIYIINAMFNQGKLFYIQERVGRNGQIFKIYKFRSMITNAEEDGAVFATTNDSRITPFGKILRKSRIDEFPQFINILKGDMAVIGPRPERPIFVNEIAEKMPYYQIRHVIKPGLTGWAQVNYQYGFSIDDSLIKLQYDLYYIKHRSIFLDISIISKTLSTILFYRGY